ncbi:adiponectin receptor protein 1, partial [Plectosphaerella plurivora]
HRAASYSYWKSVNSIFEIHNETANIWSHLLGATWFLLMFIEFFYSGLAYHISLGDGVALGLYYLCVMVCFLLSTSFHTFCDHSSDVHKLSNELDHLGIVLLMWGTGMSGTHFAFYCHPTIRSAYFALLTITAFGCGLFTLQPKFRQPDYKTTRYLMYVLLDASLFAPVLHGLLSFGVSSLEEMMGLGSFLHLAVINSFGAALYVWRIPERWYPGMFDLIGHGHNWMHVLALVGALVRLQGLLQVADAWQRGGHMHGFCNAL